MFSLQKNFIREQQKLIHQLQEETVENNLKVSGLLKSFELRNELIPYFKKIAQLYAYYYPSLEEGSNLILSLINQFDVDESNDDYIIGLDKRISQWEETLIQAKESGVQESHSIAESKEQKSIIAEKKESPVSKKATPPSTDVNSPSNKKKVVENFGGLVLVEEE